MDSTNRNLNAVIRITALINNRGVFIHAFLSSLEEIECAVKVIIAQYILNKTALKTSVLYRRCHNSPTKLPNAATLKQKLVESMQTRLRIRSQRPHMKLTRLKTKLQIRSETWFGRLHMEPKPRWQKQYIQ
ncbi:hypothetical protein F3Y22_tig00110338pilonHSYRG00110 [Hibiscus syriacus]|uniref:Uncharacterized protein n=1 Tax=Hibiscus syriacus TaxID=106335 RepID=A0A6A3AYK6_HIBSY|nr:hypothetical protein F3Y22_tig00110338pilonHSYRG00110 [Hibiscus syriacus]